MAPLFLRRLFGGAGPKICYLHVGPPKTGSTSIQRMLKKEAAALERAGVRPAIAEAPGLGERSNHSHLGAEEWFPPAGAPLETSPAWRLLSDDLARRPGPVVLSGEGFAARLRDHDDYERIVAFFLDRGFALTIVAYLRDQVGWINSTYGQVLKNLRRAVDFDDFVASSLGSPRFDFGALLDRPMADPRVRLDVGVFERAASEGLERNFLARIGAGTVQPEPQKLRNPNLGARGLYVASRLLDDHGEALARSPELRRRIDRALRRAAAERGWTDEPHMGFDETSAARVRDHFRATNDRVSQNLFGRDWSEVCPPRPVRRSALDAAGDRDDTAEVIAALAAEIAASSGKERLPA